jgi:hypothetical protein
VITLVSRGYARTDAGRQCNRVGMARNRAAATAGDKNCLK